MIKKSRVHDEEASSRCDVNLQQPDDDDQGNETKNTPTSDDAWYRTAILLLTPLSYSVLPYPILLSAAVPSPPPSCPPLPYPTQA